MPTYKVEREAKQPRVVESPTPAGARAHVAKDELTVTKIEVSEAFKLAEQGVKLEVAGEAPPAPPSDGGEQ